MLTYLAQKITALLVPANNKQDSELCQYGCEIWLYTVFSTIGLLTLGALLGFAFVTIVIVTIFYICQSNGGGYHASSHLKCFLTMVIGLLGCLTITHYIQPQWLYHIMLCLSMIIMLKHPVCLHQNKQYLSADIDLLSKRSKVVTIVISITIVIITLLGQGKIAKAGCVAMTCSSFSRLYAIRQQTKSFYRK